MVNLVVSSLFNFAREKWKLFSISFCLPSVPFFVQNIVIIFQKASFLPSPTCFLPLTFYPSVGVKSAIGGTFLCSESQFLLIIFAKTIFPLFLLFRSDNAIFHNKDNMCIFYKIQKIRKICGYWVEYKYWCFERLEKL